MSQEEAPITSFRSLSLFGRLGVALCCLEAYVESHGLLCATLADFLEYMWEWPLRLTSPDSFQAWVDAAPPFVAVGLGDPFPPAILELLGSNGVPETSFRELVQSTVEIVYGSFYAASEDARSLADLDRVLSISATCGIAPPPATIFSASRFSERMGWGAHLTASERDAWRRSGLEALRRNGHS